MPDSNDPHVGKMKSIIYDTDGKLIGCNAHDGQLYKKESTSFTSEWIGPINVDMKVKKVMFDHIDGVGSDRNLAVSVSSDREMGSLLSALDSDLGDASSEVALLQRSVVTHRFKKGKKLKFLFKRTSKWGLKLNFNKYFFLMMEKQKRLENLI